MAEASIKRNDEQKGSMKRPREPSPEPVNLAAENILKRQRAGGDTDAAAAASTGPGRAAHPEKASNSLADLTRQESNKRSDLKPSGLLEKALENMRGSQLQLKNGDPRSAARREEHAAQPVQRPMLGRETLSALLMKRDGEPGQLPDVESSSEDSLDDDWQDEDDDEEDVEGEGEGEEGEDNSLGYEYREVQPDHVGGDDDDDEEADDSDEDDPRVTLINEDGHAETRHLSEWSPEDLANNPDW